MEAEMVWMRNDTPKREEFENAQTYIYEMVNEYFVKYYIEEGYDQLINALENWLRVLEEEFGGPGSIAYGQRGQELPRREGAYVIADEIKYKANQLPQPETSDPLLSTLPLEEPHLLDLPVPFSGISPLEPSQMYQPTPQVTYGEPIVFEPLSRLRDTSQEPSTIQFEDEDTVFLKA